MQDELGVAEVKKIWLDGDVQLIMFVIRIARSGVSYVTLNGMSEIVRILSYRKELRGLQNNAWELV